MNNPQTYFPDMGMSEVLSVKSRHSGIVHAVEGPVVLCGAKINTVGCLWVDQGKLSCNRCRDKLDMEPVYPKNSCTPAEIGSGPPGEKCGTCLNFIRSQHGDKEYFKCDAVRSQWTHGAKSDIKASWPACYEWNARTIITDSFKCIDRVDWNPLEDKDWQTSFSVLADQCEESGCEQHTVHWFMRNKPNELIPF